MSKISSRILIVGGYGKVGSNTAEFLLAKSPHQITIAGRSLSKAKEALGNFSNSERLFALQINVQDSVENLKKIICSYDYVIVCIDSIVTNLAEACVQLGIQYIDVTSDDSFHQKLEQMNIPSDAKSKILLSVGLTPGITNLMAKKMMIENPQAQEIDLSIILGSGEKHGEAAVMWTLKELFNSALANAEKISNAFYGPKIGSRFAFPFNFSDQYSLGRSYPHKKFVTRFSIDHKFLSGFIFLLYKLPLLTILAKMIPLKLVAKIMDQFSSGSEDFALLIEGIEKDQNIKNKFLFSGSREGKITGIVAGLAVIGLIDRSDSKVGVFHIHDLFNLEEFIMPLKEYGCDFSEYKN